MSRHLRRHRSKLEKLLLLRSVVSCSSSKIEFGIKQSFFIILPAAPGEKNLPDSALQKGALVLPAATATARTKAGSRRAARGAGVPTANLLGCPLRTSCLERRAPPGRGFGALSDENLCTWTRCPSLPKPRAPHRLMSTADSEEAEREKTGAKKAKPRRKEQTETEAKVKPAWF